MLGMFSDAPLLCFEGSLEICRWVLCCLFLSTCMGGVDRHGCIGNVVSSGPGGNGSGTAQGTPAAPPPLLAESAGAPLGCLPSSVDW